MKRHMGFIETSPGSSIKDRLAGMTGVAPRTLETIGTAAALFSIPLILIALNGIWMANRYGDPDTWFYHGHFLELLKKTAEPIQITFDYYRTRLPYIIPGSLVYYLFGRDLAPAVFSVVIIYGTIITSFWYVLSRHTVRPAAFAGAALLACDLYFLRSVGWQYVDNGVIAYQTLTFAMIAASVQRGNNAIIFNALAGCAAGSMLFTHLGSCIVLPLFVAYEYFLISQRQAPRAILADLIRAGLAAGAGALAVTVVYSLLNAAIYHVGPFFMIGQQLSVAAKELDRTHVTLLQSGALTDGFWLTVHFGVLVACLAVLSRFVFLPAAERRDRATEIFFFAAAAASQLITIFLEIVNVAYYLLRDGEYISFYLPVTYFALTFLLFDRHAARWRDALLICLLAMVSAVLRLNLAGGDALHVAPRIPMFALALGLGLALLTASMAARTRFATPAAALFVALTLFLPCRFTRDDNIAYAEQAIRGVAGDRTPHIYYDINDAVGAGFLNSVTGSFTERAWLQHGAAYPDISVTESPVLTRFRAGDVIVVLTSTIADADAVRGNVEGYLGQVRPIASVRLDRPGFLLWAHSFELLSTPDRPGDGARVSSARAE